MGSRGRGSGKAKPYSSNLYLNVKNYEAFLYTSVTSVEYQILLLTVDVYDNIIVIVVKAFIECLLRVRHYDSYFKGRISLMTDGNLTG